MIIADALLFLVAKAGIIGLRLVFLYGIATYMDSTKFGAVAFAFTIAEVSRLIADWGADIYSLRLFSHPDVKHATIYLRRFLGLRACAAVVAWIIAYTAISLLAPLESRLMICLVAGTTVTSLLLNVGVNWFQARAKLFGPARILAALSILGCCLQFFGIYRRASVLDRLSWLLVIEGIMCLSILGMLRLSTFITIPDVFAGLSAKTFELLRGSTPIACASIFAIVASRADQFLIDHFFPANLLGNYQLANRMVEPFLLASTALASTIYSRASFVYQQNVSSNGINRLVSKWIRFMVGYGLSIALIVGSLSVSIVARFFPNYPFALTFIWIALATFVFRCLNLCLTAFIQAAGGFNAILTISSRNLLIIVAACLIGMRLGGAQGIALGVTAGEMMNVGQQGWLLYWLLKRNKDDMSNPSD